MSTFDRFKKDSESFEDRSNENERSNDDGRAVREEYLDDDSEFDFEFSNQAEEDVSIEGAADAAVDSPYEVAKLNITRIGEETVVTGNIKTKGHIDVLGTVKGNVDAEGNVAIRSDINGNIKGNNIGLGTCVVTGNIDATKNILTDSESEINGNIKGSEISIAGQVSGDIKASNVIVLKRDAVLEGDIETDDLVVEPGAIINGKVTISRKPRKIGSRERETEKIVEPVVKPEEKVVDAEDSDIVDV